MGWLLDERLQLVVLSDQSAERGRASSEPTCYWSAPSCASKRFIVGNGSSFVAFPNVPSTRPREPAMHLFWRRCYVADSHRLIIVETRCV